MIELTDVDLKNIGEEKIKSLKTILADYYLFNNIEGKIFVCVLDEKNREVKFKEVEKKIYFSTMYAIFDNTESKYYKNLKPEIYLTKPLEPKHLDKPRPTIVLSNDEFGNLLQGEIEVVNLKGEIVRKEYSLNGWIGIHGSLEEVIQKRNGGIPPEISHTDPHLSRKASPAAEATVRNVDSRDRLAFGLSG